MNNLELLQRQVMYFVGMQGGIKGGSFNEALIIAIFLADRGNRIKLQMGFPELVGIICAYQTGRGVEKYPLIQEAVREDR